MSRKTFRLLEGPLSFRKFQLSLTNGDCSVPSLSPHGILFPAIAFLRNVLEVITSTNSNRDRNRNSYYYSSTDRLNWIAKHDSIRNVQLNSDSNTSNSWSNENKNRCKNKKKSKMNAENVEKESVEKISDSSLQTNATYGIYPSPVTPCPTERAHSVERQRAVAAEVLTSSATLDDIITLYDDAWLTVLLKPPGIYCERILKAVEEKMNESGKMEDTSSFSEESKEVKKTALFGTKNGRRVRDNLHLLNRLDRDTSGAIIVSKTAEVTRILANAFANRLVRKSYIALCFGKHPIWKEQVVTTGHGRSRFGLWRVYNHSDVGRSLPGGSVVKEMVTKFAFLGISKGPMLFEDNILEKVAESKEKGGLEILDSSITPEGKSSSELFPHYRSQDDLRIASRLGIHEVKSIEANPFLESSSSKSSLCSTSSQAVKLKVIHPKYHIKESVGTVAILEQDENVPSDDRDVAELINKDADSKNGFFLVRAFPTTGRTHQIRLHCQHLGIPIAGDVRYGGPELGGFKNVTWNMHALHAETISFFHPVKKIEIVISAPLPPWAVGIPQDQEI